MVRGRGWVHHVRTNRLAMDRNRDPKDCQVFFETPLVIQGFNPFFLRVETQVIMANLGGTM